MPSLALLYWMLAVGYAVQREDYEGRPWEFAFVLLLNIFAFPCVLASDICKLLNRPNPSHIYNCNIHNHTDGNVTVTRL